MGRDLNNSTIAEMAAAIELRNLSPAEVAGQLPEIAPLLVTNWARV